MLKNKRIRVLLLIAVFQLVISQNAFAYLDPGTGSFIFQVLVAAVVGGLFTLKMFWKKIRIFFRNHLSNRKRP